MTHPLVQEYLLTHSLAQLRAEHGIKSSSAVGLSWFSLNYDQIESKAGPMVNQCRGIVLGIPTPGKLTEGQVTGMDPVGETWLMARPMDRFFNLGDSQSAPIDLTDKETVFFEKLDGTMCIVYYNAVLGSWEVATRAVPLADKVLTGWEDLTFRNLFEQALVATLDSKGWQYEISMAREDIFNLWCSKLNKHYTYTFELTTPMNRIVVRYDNYRIHLLGIRATQTGLEVDPCKDLKGVEGVDVCPSHKLNNLEEMLAFVGSKPPFEQEGLVVRDYHFNRVKVKSLAYMAYNRLRDSTANSPRAVMELILTKNLDDVIGVLDIHIQPKALEMQEGTRALFQRFEEEYQEIAEEAKGCANERKAFALGVQERGAWMAPLMDRFLGKCSSLEEFIEKRRTSNGSYPDGFLDAMIEEIRQ